MEQLKGKNGHFQFSPKSYSPSDVTANHCFLKSFCLIYKLKRSNFLLKMGWISPSRASRLWGKKRFMVKPHISDIRMTYEYIQVTYGWHTGAYGWHTDDIWVHTSEPGWGTTLTQKIELSLQYFTPESC